MAEEVVQMRMDSEIVQELDSLAKDTGIGNRTGVVRWLIRREYERRQVASKPVDGTLLANGAQVE